MLRYVKQLSLSTQISTQATVSCAFPCPNCELCVGGVCKICSDGYFRSSDGKCLSCLNFDADCQTCSASGCLSRTYRKLYYYLLANGGSILSSKYDSITLKLTTSEISVRCTEAPHGYTFTPGVSKRFVNSWIPIRNQPITIGLEQYNFWTKNDAVTVTRNFKTSELGYYSLSLNISQFIPATTVSIQFLGITLSISQSSYTANSDYYLLFELRNENVTVGANVSPNVEYGESSWSLGAVYLLNIANLDGLAKPAVIVHSLKDRLFILIQYSKVKHSLISCSYIRSSVINTSYQTNV